MREAAKEGAEGAPGERASENAARRPRQARDQPSLGRRQDERDWRELEQHEVLDLMHEKEVRRPLVEG
jgi:hypothetical protein